MGDNSVVLLTNTFKGAAILQELNKNHHKAFLGIKFIKPLLINNLRLLNRL